MAIQIQSDMLMETKDEFWPGALICVGTDIYSMHILSINFKVTQPCWTQIWVGLLSWVYSSSLLNGVSTIALYNDNVNANEGALLCEKQE